MSSIVFRVEKMHRFPEGGHLKAFADVSVNDVLVIRGVRLVEGKKGFFVNMPQEQGKDNRWYDQIVCRSTAVFNDLSEKVLDYYKNEN